MMKTRYQLYLLSLFLLTLPLRAAQLPCDNGKAPHPLRNFITEVSTALGDLQLNDVPYPGSKMRMVAADTLIPRSVEFFPAPKLVSAPIGEYSIDITRPNVKIERDKKPLDSKTREAWFRACADGDLNKARTIYATYRIDVNATELLGWTNTPLHWASMYGHLDIAQFLVEDCNANINVQDKYKNTPLQWACFGDNLDVVRFLVNDAGANVDVKNKKNNTPLHYACLRGNLDIVRFLVNDAGAVLNIRNNDGLFWGDTPLDVAKKKVKEGLWPKKKYQAIVNFLESR